MKFTNGKWNKNLLVGILLYCIMALDIIINTVIAQVTNNGVSRITNALMIGPIVFNPLSVLFTFALGTLCILIGLFLRYKDRSH